MTNEDNQKLRFKERNQGPSNINVAASDEVKKVPAIQAVIEQSKYGTLQRVGNSFWDACKDFGDTILSGTNNGMTPPAYVLTVLHSGFHLVLIYYSYNHP